jgi:hypothetical protein
MPPIADHIERAWGRFIIAWREIARGFTASAAGVGAAAGALVAFSFTMSPPLTLLPPRPGDANGNPTFHRSTEIVVASADEFDGRWHAAIKDVPPMPTSKVTVASADEFDGRWHAAIKDIPSMPTSTVKDAFDLQGSNVLAMMAMVPSQEPLADPGGFASVANQEHTVALVAPKPSAQPSDVCARNGLRRIEYTRNHHRYWRCLHGQRASSDRQTVSAATPLSNREPSVKEQQPLYGLQLLRGFFFQSSQ